MNNFYFLENYAKSRQQEIEQEMTMLLRGRTPVKRKKSFMFHRLVLRVYLLIFK